MDLSMIFTIFLYNLLWSFMRVSTTENIDNNDIFMAGLSRFYLHGNVNSYFGYSISSYVGQEKAYCLVGAPRDETYDENTDKNFNTGAVYRISFENDDCSFVPMDSGDTNAQGSQGYSNWLGGSVATAVNGMDGVQLGCDPRFVSKISYGVNKSEQQLLGIGQCSLYTGSSLNHISIQACSANDEGACLSGFSSSLLADDSKEIKVALGLPGSFLTEGNVFLASYRGKSMVDKVLLKTSPSDLKNRGYNLGYDIKLARLWDGQKDKSPFTNAISNEVVVTSSPHWKSNDYRGVILVLDVKLDMSQIEYIPDTNGHLGSNFGSSLAVGDFNGDKILDIIAGAPFYTDYWTSSKRLVDVGSVHIFYGRVSDKQRYTISEKNDILKGTKVRGKFGMSITTLGDIDGDNIDDFAVGCPNCGNDDTGSVYIYLGGSSKPAQIIRPRNLNHVTVVPLCNPFNEKQIMRPFQNFGWSLTGKFDLDHNSVPDLVVGDYSSSQVVVLRSKNLIWLEHPIWVLPPSQFIEWTSASQTDQPCPDDVCRYYMSLKASVVGRRISTNENITLRAVINLDTQIENENSKRLQLVSSKVSIFERSIEFVFSRSNTTIELFSGLVEPRFEAVNLNIWKPLIVNISISYKPKTSTEIDSKDNFFWMIHPFKGSKFFSSPVHIFKNPDCGLDYKCMADIQVFISDWSLNVYKTDIYYGEKVQERRVVIGISNRGEHAYNVKLKITIPSVFEFQGLKGLNCTLSVTKDGANVIAICQYPNPFVSNRNQIRKLFLTLNTGGAFRYYKKNKRKSDSSIITMKVEGTCENQDLNTLNNKWSIDYFLRLSGSVQITPKNIETTYVDSRNFSSKVSSFQRVYPDTLGPSYQGSFLVTNDGPSPLETVVLTFSLPYKTINGENILYFLRRINQQDASGNPMSISQLPQVFTIRGPAHGICNIPESSIDPLNLNAIARNPNQNHRHKRSAALVEDLDNIKSSPQKSISIIPKVKTRHQEIISCNNTKSVLGDIECINIKCTLFNLTLQSEVRITIKARIWAETFFHYKISDSVIYTSVFGNINPISYGFNVSGDLHISPINISHNVIFKGIEDMIISSLPVWPIVLGVLLGLILLTIIILLLWKCGFFQRHRQYKAEIIEDSNGHNGYISRYNYSFNSVHL